MKINARKFAVMLAAAVVLVAGFALPPSFRHRTLHPNASVALPDGTVYQVQIADTPALRDLGLGNLPALGTREGMLFVFPDASRPIFWMKDMKFPIDIVWLKKGKGVEGLESFEVVDKEQNAPVPPDPANPDLRYLPEADADLVLELPAGAFAAHHLANGDHLDIRLPAGYTAPTN